jgi:rubredoxin
MNWTMAMRNGSQSRAGCPAHALAPVTHLEDLFVAVACPRCGYVRDVELLDVHLQRRIFCPGCKSAIQLVDKDASMHTAREQADEAINNMLKSVRRLGGNR